MRSNVLWTVLGIAVCSGAAIAEDWNQWRGPHRDGVARFSPTLVESIPESGLQPVWRSEPIASGGSGGWSSPVAADGKVYVFAHHRERKKGDVKVPKRKYPWLPPDKRGHLTNDQYVEYERHRRQEDLDLGTIYYAFSEVLYCLDAETGETVWKRSRPSVYSRFLQSGSPAVVAGKVYVLGAGRHARCIDAATGEDHWETRLPGEFLDEYMMSSFAVADQTAVVLAGRLFGLDCDTGEILWQGDQARTRGSHASPVVWQRGQRELMVTNVGGADTICFEPRTGKELWRIRSEAHFATPVIVGDRMVTYGNSRKKGVRCFRISETEATPLWTSNGLADKGSSPVVVDGHVYVQGERRLACVNLETGKAGWQTMLDLNNPQYTSLVAADRKVFYAYDGIQWFAADPKGFRPLVVAKIDKEGRMASEQTFRRLLGLDKLGASNEALAKAQRVFQNNVGGHGPLRCSSPAIVAGRLIVRLKDAVVCYDLKDGKALSSN